MRFFSAPIGVWNFCVDPVTEQKRLAAGGWIKIEYGLPVMFLHDQHQIGLAQVLQG